MIRILSRQQDMDMMILVGIRLETIYADVFGGEAGLVRPQIISGTHAISTALFGILRPGDEFFTLLENHMIH